MKKRISFLITASLILSTLTPAFASTVELNNVELNTTEEITTQTDYPDYYPEDLDVTIARWREEASKKADEIIASIITDDMNDFEKAFYAYKWMVNHVEYSHYYVDIDTPTEKEQQIIDELGEDIARVTVGEAYGALVLNSCICEGYSQGYMMLMNKLGIECKHIGYELPGYGGGLSTAHAWNSIKIEGKWYYVDTQTKCFLNEIIPGSENDLGFPTAPGVERAKYKNIYNENMPIRVFEGVQYGGAPTENDYYNSTNHTEPVDENNSEQTININRTIIDDIYIDIDPNLVYTGKKIQPMITISSNNQGIGFSGKSKDIKIKITNNKNAGTATVEFL